MKKIVSLVLVFLLILSLGIGVFASETKKLGNATFSDIEGFEIIQETKNNIMYSNPKNDDEYIIFTYIKGITAEVEDVTELIEEELYSLLENAYNEKTLSDKLSKENGVYINVEASDLMTDYFITEKNIPFYYGEVKYKASAVGYEDIEDYISSAIFAKGKDLYVVDYTNNQKSEIGYLLEFLDTIEFIEEKEYTEADFAPNAIKIKVDGKYVMPDSEPQIVNDRTLCPIRVVAEKLGYSVDWEGATRTAIITDGKTTLRIKIGENIIEKTQVQYVMDLAKDVTRVTKIESDVSAQIINDRTYLPLRAVGEALGCSVDWDGATRTVIITSK